MSTLTGSEESQAAPEHIDIVKKPDRTGEPAPDIPSPELVGQGGSGGLRSGQQGVGRSWLISPFPNQSLKT